MGKIATKFKKAIGEDLQLLVQASQEEAGTSVADMDTKKSMRGLVMSRNRSSLRSMRSLRARSMRGFSQHNAMAQPPPSSSIEPLVCMPTAKHVQQWLERNVEQDGNPNAIEWRFAPQKERQHH